MMKKLFLSLFSLLCFTFSAHAWEIFGDESTISDVIGLQTTLDTKANLTSPTFTGTVAGITKTMVGLGSVDNTADSAKSISTATQVALDNLGRDWTPNQDFTTGLQIMFRPEELPASGNITAWNDVSGNARNLSQGGSASPVVSGALLNGYRVAQFASGSDRLSTVAIPAIHGTEVTIFAIFEHPAAAVSAELMGQVDTADGSKRRAYISPKWVDNNMYADVGNSAGSRMVFGSSTFVGDEVFHIMSVRRSGTTSGEIWRNGTSVVTDATLDTPVAFSANMPFNIGNGDGTSEAFAGKIAEIIIYNTALTTAEREKIEGYLAHKYGLQANLPASHTYKASSPVVTYDNLVGDVTSVGNTTTVVKNANLTGHVTSVGNATSLGSFTAAQLNTAVSDADVAPLASPTLTGTIQLDGSPILGDGANHGQRSFSDIAGATMLMTNTTGTASTTTATTDIAARYVKPGTSGTKYNAALDVVVGSHTAGINANTQVDFRLANGAVNTPDTTVLTLKSDGTALIGTVQVATVTGTQTLTNKTVALGSNTVSGTLAEFNTAVSDADIASAAFSGSRVTLSAGQSIATTLGVAMSWNTETYDTTTYHDNVTNPSRLTASVAGYYRIGAKVQWDTNATGERSIGYRISAGSTDWTVDHAADATANTAQSFSTDVYLTAGQYVEIMVYQTSGANLSTTGTSTWATMGYLGN